MTSAGIYEKLNVSISGIRRLVRHVLFPLANNASTSGNKDGGTVAQCLLFGAEESQSQSASNHSRLNNSIENRKTPMENPPQKKCRSVTARSSTALSSSDLGARLTLFNCFTDKRMQISPWGRWEGSGVSGWEGDTPACTCYGCREKSKRGVDAAVGCVAVGGRGFGRRGFSATPSSQPAGPGPWGGAGALSPSCSFPSLPPLPWRQQPITYHSPTKLRPSNATSDVTLFFFFLFFFIKKKFFFFCCIFHFQQWFNCWPTNAKVNWSSSLLATRTNWINTLFNLIIYEMCFSSWLAWWLHAIK